MRDCVPLRFIVMPSTKRSPARSRAAAAVLPAPVEAVTRVVLIEDHPIFRAGLKYLVEECPGFKVCGETDNAVAAIKLVEKEQPDIALVDISLNGSNGIELTKALHEQAPALQILVISMHDEMVYAERALRAGAAGYLMKDQAVDQLAEALEAIMRGETYLSKKMEERLMGGMAAHAKQGVQAFEAKLADRELEVLELIGRGYNLSSIGAQLGADATAVAGYLATLKKKLQLADEEGLRRFAIEWAHGAVR